MGEWANRRGSLASFRQKGVRRARKNWILEALEGSCDGSGGFVWNMRDVAMKKGGEGVLRELRQARRVW
jgi:hypothetical protein